MKEFESLETTEEFEKSLGKHTKISHSSGWKPVNAAYIEETFAPAPARPLTDDDVAERVLQMFNRHTDPLSVDGLQQAFPTFPIDWSHFVSKSVADKFVVVDKRPQNETTRTDGKFRLSFQ